MTKTKTEQREQKKLSMQALRRRRSMCADVDALEKARVADKERKQEERRQTKKHGMTYARKDKIYAKIAECKEKID